MKLYSMYILASINRVLYIGVTGKLEQRLHEHRAHTYPRSFTAQYNVTRLVYCEQYAHIGDAIRREKQLKGWRRAKKIALIERANPGWTDVDPDGLYRGS